MSSAYSSDKRFAILIDADNIAEKYVKIILEEVSNYGIATYKRIYGDWTNTRMTRWKSCLLDNSITPMQQYSYTFGKNATDSAMIIDAMDILYSGTVDGFAIVSSDSDFTRLASRLRESGMQVIGMGEQKTPQPFIAACNQFKYLDLLFASQKAQVQNADADDNAHAESGDSLRTQRRRSGKPGRRIKVLEAGAEGEGEQTEALPLKTSGRPRRRPGDAGGAGASCVLSTEGEDAEESIEVAFGEMSKADRRRHMKKIRDTIEAVIDTFSDDDGWVSLGQLGDQLGKRLPDFDVRNYGFRKLRPFLKSLGVYEFNEPTGQSGQRQIYLRLKES